MQIVSKFAWNSQFSEKNWHFEMYFSQKIYFWHFMQIVSCLEKIFMKCQSLFFWEKKKKYFKMLSSEIFSQYT